MALERLDKLLASTGHWSRREVKDLVRQGRVLADGRPAARPEDKFDPDRVRLSVDGREVDCAPFVYLMLHKPAGLLSATEDRNQKTVLDLLPEHLRRVGLFPAGFDKDGVLFCNQNFASYPHRIPAGRLDCGSQKRGHRAADGRHRDRAHLRRTAAHGGRD